ncbi:HET-domain-containing protein [Bimuria novae-zelandiae CBS 107.79]|uniref:HET-domain-containing protein n=1 Tax=Bimuria novae-zelandiae CBS 107.79 TaxID=1447943 RepID=A0A6A5UFF0_9PLEO|nr:HET-domain-containing protein [Bimuria novae-zelandiae CBS 107.79]
MTTVLTLRVAAISRQAPWVSSASVKDKITKIKRWLENCKSNHGNHCMPKAKRIPHRLIDGGTSEHPPRLVLGQQIAIQNQQYTTLSHCWGASLPIRTLLSNLQLYSDQIPPQTIPRTFEDAMLITRELGVRFIWIDALCIVQDDAKEWEQEAAKMKDIYSGSILNIAACDSPGSAGGCFSMNRSLTQTFHLPLVEGVPKLLVRLQPGDTRQFTKQTILSSRGWVLQEQLLSHRIISCMSDELHWECSEAYETELGIQFNSHPSDIRGDPRMYQCPTRWHVVNFSERNFTYWNDRLPTLSGIAENYESITGDISIIGLWQRSLIQDLLWIRMGPIAPKPARGIGAAGLPSWSWMSCPSRIKFNIWQLTMRVRQIDRYVRVQEYCKLIDFSVTWAGISFVSALKSAHIVLYGPSVEVTIDIEGKLEQSNPPSFTVRYLNGVELCTGAI